VSRRSGWRQRDSSPCAVECCHSCCCPPMRAAPARAPVGEAVEATVENRFHGVEHRECPSRGVGGTRCFDPAALIAAARYARLPKRRDFPDPGQLNVGVLRGAGAPVDIMAALEGVIGQILDVLALTRSAAWRLLASRPRVQPAPACEKRALRGMAATVLASKLVCSSKTERVRGAAWRHSRAPFRRQTSSRSGARKRRARPRPHIFAICFTVFGVPPCPRSGTFSVFGGLARTD
jgi:hypothetical protein